MPSKKISDLKARQKSLEDQLEELKKELHEQVQKRRKQDVEQQQAESTIKKRDLKVIDYVPEEYKGTIEPYRMIKAKKVIIDSDLMVNYPNWLRSVTYRPEDKFIEDVDDLANVVKELVQDQKIDWKKEGIEFLTVFTTESNLTRTIRAFQANKVTDVTRRYASFAEDVVDQWEKAGYEGFTLGAEPIKEVKIIFRIIEKYGGCNSDREHKKQLNGLLLLSPKAVNNNCFIMCVLKATKKIMKPASVRKLCKIERGKMIDFEDARKVCELLKCNVTIYDENLEELQDIEIEKDLPLVKIVLHEKHYFILENADFSMKTCGRCGQPYKKKHVCSKTRSSYYQKRIKQQVEQIDQEDVSQDWKELCKDCIVFDFETFHDVFELKRHVVYSAGWYDFTTEKYHSAYGKDALDEFMNYILDLNKQGRECVLVSYNGSGFDHYMINKWLHNSEIKIDRYSYRNGQIQCLWFNGMNTTTDLYLFMNPYSLDKACEAFKIKVHKSAFPHRFASKWEDVYYVGPKLDNLFYPLNMRENIPEYENGLFDFQKENLTYLKLDVTCTMELLKAFSVEVSKMVGISIFEKMTISQMAYDKWRATLEQEEDVRLFKFDDQYTMAENAMAGGRSCPFKTYFKSKWYNEIMANKKNVERLKELYVLCDDYLIDGDVVSLYPTSMLEKYPIGISRMSKVDEIKEIQQFLNGKEYEKIPLSIMIVDVTPNNKLYIPVIHCKDNSNITQSVTKWNYEHRKNQTYTSVDIIEAHKRGYQFKIKKVMKWERSSNVFVKYINMIYKIKQEEDKLKDEKDPRYNPVRRAVSKMLMNSLYGKTCQKRIDEVHIVVEDKKQAEEFFKKYKWADFDTVGSKYIFVGTQRTYSKTVTKPIQLGAFVLAYSRKIMNELTDLLDPDRYTDIEKSKQNSPYYQDTDSLFFHNSQLPLLQHKFAGKVKELGQLDDELEGGKIILGYFLAPKLYCVVYLTKEGKIKEKMRAKGVKAELLKVEHYRNMYEKNAKETYKFDMLKKIKRHLTGKDVSNGLDKYSIVTVKDAHRTLNQTKWAGRTAVDGVITLPLGFSEK